MRKAGGCQVLDLGCGIGRHTVALSRMGFTVTATDVSPSGLASCAAWLAREGLSATLVRHEMETFPFPNSAYDGLIAYNVIYHTTVVGMQQVLAEIHRVLRPGGQFYTTVIARDEDNIAFYRADVEAGKCQEIEPFTFIYLHDAPGDKHLPHHYCDEVELRALLAGFVVDDLRLVHEEYADADGTTRFMQDYGEPLDLLVIHIDASIAHRPEIDLERLCPPASDTANALRALVIQWIGGQLPDKVIVAVPSKTTDAWVCAAFVGRDDLLECDPEPLERLAEVGDLGFKLKRMPGGKVRKPSAKRYEIHLAPRVEARFDQVRSICGEAERFAQDMEAQCA